VERSGTHQYGAGAMVGSAPLHPPYESNETGACLDNLQFGGTTWRDVKRYICKWTTAR
jgi:hypothetical protein